MNQFNGAMKHVLGKHPGRGCLWGILQLVLMGFAVGLLFSYVAWRLWQ